MAEARQARALPARTTHTAAARARTHACAPAHLSPTALHRVLLVETPLTRSPPAVLAAAQCRVFVVQMAHPPTMTAPAPAGPHCGLSHRTARALRACRPLAHARDTRSSPTPSAAHASALLLPCHVLTHACMGASRARATAGAAHAARTRPRSRYARRDDPPPHAHTHSLSHTHTLTLSLYLPHTLSLTHRLWHWHLHSSHLSSPISHLPSLTPHPMPPLPCLLSHVSSLIMSHASCPMSHASHVSCVPCPMSHVPCLMSHVSYLISHLSSLSPHPVWEGPGLLRRPQLPILQVWEGTSLLWMPHGEASAMEARPIIVNILSV